MTHEIRTPLNAIVGFTNILVDETAGELDEEEKKDISLRFRGSSNQRIIDVPKTLESGNLTLWQG